MNGFNINGIQQVGVGTTDFRQSWDWYIEHFGFDIKILEDDTVAERMLPYTGGRPQKRHACITVNLNGGGGLEIWQYSDRQPQDPTQRVLIGDLGVFAAKIHCRDVAHFRKQLLRQGLRPSEVAPTPSGQKVFYVTDLFGNLLQVAEDSYTFVRQAKPVGGVAGAITGVSDMEKSIAFYRDLLGYDTVEYDVSGIQADWKDYPGGGQSYRRVLLGRSQKPSGAFSGLLGPHCIELVQALDRKPKKIYEGRYWGDPGFIQVCYDVSGMDAFAKHCAALGHPFTVDSCPDGEIFDMGEASGRFTYVEDPDGSLIEFVETYQVPIAKKLRLVIDMKKRRPDKTLPKILFRAMGLVSRQPKPGKK